MSMFSRQRRIARQPRKGFNSSADIYRAWSEFVAAEIKRSDNQRIGPDALRYFSIRFDIVRLSVGSVVRFK